MIYPFSTTGLSWALFSTAAVVNAVPHALLRRDDSYEIVDCGGNTDRIQKALDDAAALAKIAEGIDDESTAFTHYLRKDDKSYATDLWKTIAMNNDPSTAPYQFTIRCVNSCTGDEANSLAVTDATPPINDVPRREMKICPLFFTSARTANNLDSKKYDGDKRGSWCQTGQKFKDFETAGHTILHEMTHLDAVGTAAGMPERAQDGFRSHGTDDVVGYGDDYVTTARAFLSDWVNHADEMHPNALKPYQNAENIAAAATEWWFLQSCKDTLQEISL
ncbi:hypothetical protein DIS24_g6682 [Lasiodiplodia hormozganensis]|uniref:Lysine-specific metallo-endopeptidase domain-containing protein n=1 Tax=Lasiodiplodia hormozganensis TaxID=869390 RepID=A0AA40CVD2_9PEZI|nr:hypothetical protein DIS24_g6682 [Lasiodiplodia hormozganensis]